MRLFWIVGCGAGTSIRNIYSSDFIQNKETPRAFVVKL